MKEDEITQGMRVRLKGFSALGVAVEGLRGKVDELHEDGTVAVLLDLPNVLNIARTVVFASQCVKLRKKARRAAA